MSLQSRQEMVLLVDQDAALQAALSAAIRAQGFVVHSFPSSESCLGGTESLSSELAICVVSELNFAGASGLELQERLNALNRPLAMIFFTEEAAVRDIVTAMQNGALSVLEKREGVAAVVAHLDQAMEHARQTFECVKTQRKAMSQLKSLNVGEQEVLDGILKGQLNKEIAQRLNLSVRTIEQRRRQVFRKLDVQHPASLAKKVLQASQPNPVAIASDSFEIPTSGMIVAPASRRRADVCLAE